MAKENNIKKELLKQDANVFDDSYNTGVKSAQKIIIKDNARVERMKKVTVLSWLLVIISLLTAGIIEALPGPHPMWFPPTAVIVVQALFIIAVSFTISLYVRARTLTLHKIQAKLADIEEQLKRISQDK